MLQAQELLQREQAEVASLLSNCASIILQVRYPWLTVSLFMHALRLLP